MSGVGGNSDDLERRLSGFGEAWRAQQTPPPEADLDRLAVARTVWSSPRVWAPVAAVAGVAAVVAAVALPLTLGRGGEQTPGGEQLSAGGAQSQPAVVGPGTPMSGIGTFLREKDGTVKFCSGVGVLLSLPPAGAGCNPPFVLATGVPEQWFTEEATSGQKWSTTVKVLGAYAGGTLAVTNVEPATQDSKPFAEPSVPCPAPPGGWPLGDGLPAGSDQDGASAVNRLAEHVRGRPDKYSDLWQGHPDGPPKAEHSYMPSRIVYVVGTTGDVDEAKAELAAIYPGSLCVHKLTHTAADLEAIANQLKSVSSTPIEAEVLVIENKVRVKVVALDPQTNSILDAVGRDTLVIDEPLLQWAD